MIDFLRWETISALDKGEGVTFKLHGAIPFGEVSGGDYFSLDVGAKEGIGDLQVTVQSGQNQVAVGFQLKSICGSNH